MDASVVAKIKKEYIEGNDSVRGLCRKHGLPSHQHVAVISKREDWAGQRQRFRDEILTRTAEKTASKIAEAADKILDKTLALLEGKLTAQELKQLTDVARGVRDLQATYVTGTNDEVGVVILPAVMAPAEHPEDDDE